MRLIRRAFLITYSLKMIVRFFNLTVLFIKDIMRATFLQSQNYKIIIYYKKDLEMCIILSYIYIYFFLFDLH